MQRSECVCQEGRTTPRTRLRRSLERLCVLCVLCGQYVPVFHQVCSFRLAIYLVHLSLGCFNTQNTMATEKLGAAYQHVLRWFMA